MSYLVNRSHKYHETPAHRFVHRCDCLHTLVYGPRWTGARPGPERRQAGNRGVQRPDEVQPGPSYEETVRQS